LTHLISVLKLHVNVMLFDYWKFSIPHERALVEFSFLEIVWPSCWVYWWRWTENYKDVVSFSNMYIGPLLQRHWNWIQALEYCIMWKYVNVWSDLACLTVTPLLMSLTWFKKLRAVCSTHIHTYMRIGQVPNLVSSLWNEETVALIIEEMLVMHLFLRSLMEWMPNRKPMQSGQKHCDIGTLRLCPLSMWLLLDPAPRKFKPIDIIKTCFMENSFY
jgi:hypothetical protein